MTGLVLAAGAATWLVTLVLTEGYVFRSARDWVSTRRVWANDRYELARTAVLRAKPDHQVTMTPTRAALAARELTDRINRQNRAGRVADWWVHADYLVRCPLCLGVWVAAALVALPGMPRPFGGGLIGWALAALVVKAVAHLILEGAAFLRRAG